MSGRNFATRADFRSALNFHKCPDYRLVADDATVEVDEFWLGDAYSLSELDVFANRHIDNLLHTDFSCRTPRLLIETEVSAAAMECLLPAEPR